MPTKISIISVLLLATCSMTIQAQQAIKPEKHLKGGIIASKLINTPWESSFAPGFSVGLSLDFRFNSLISVQPEVLYVQKGSREYVSSIDTDFDLTLDYVEIPILTQIHLPSLGLLHPHFYLGPYASFLIENNSSTELIDSDQLTPDQFVKQANTGDFGAVLGIGTDLYFPFNTMTAEIRYSTGLTDLFDENRLLSFRNGTIMFLIGFNF